MAWYNFWKKQPVKVAKKVAAVEQPQAALKVIDYPKSQYKVYWETHLFEQTSGEWVAEIRFIGYNGHDHRTYHSVAAPTRTSAEQLAQKLIVEKMSDYKR
jgi:hypothetical protein